MQMLCYPDFGLLVIPTRSDTPAAACCLMDNMNNGNAGNKVHITEMTRRPQVWFFLLCFDNAVSHGGHHLRRSSSLCGSDGEAMVQLLILRGVLCKHITSSSSLFTVLLTKVEYRGVPFVSILNLHQLQDSLMAVTITAASCLVARERGTLDIVEGALGENDGNGMHLAPWSRLPLSKEQIHRAEGRYVT
jgi:hypothetical protein